MKIRQKLVYRRRREDERFLVAFLRVDLRAVFLREEVFFLREAVFFRDAVFLRAGFRAVLRFFVVFFREDFLAALRFFVVFFREDFLALLRFFAAIIDFQGAYIITLSNYANSLY